MRVTCASSVRVLCSSISASLIAVTSITAAGRLISPAMGYNVDMFDSAIRHPQSILVSIILPVFRGALGDLPEARNVFRVNSFAHDEFNARRGRPVVQLKN